MREDHLDVRIFPLAARYDEVGSSFERFVGDLRHHEYTSLTHYADDFTSVMGRPRKGSGYGVDEGVWLPCRKTTAFRLLSSSHIGSYRWAPM